MTVVPEDAGVPEEGVWDHHHHSGGGRGGRAWGVLARKGRGEAAGKAKPIGEMLPTLKCSCWKAVGGGGIPQRHFFKVLGGGVWRTPQGQF